MPKILSGVLVPWSLHVLKLIHALLTITNALTLTHLWTFRSKHSMTILLRFLCRKKNSPFTHYWNQRSMLQLVLSMYILNCSWTSAILIDNKWFFSYSNVDDYSCSLFFYLPIHKHNLKSSVSPNYKTFIWQVCQFI